MGVNTAVIVIERLADGAWRVAGGRLAAPALAETLAAAVDLAAALADGRPARIVVRDEGDRGPRTGRTPGTMEM